jgi:hypothetical protein
MTTTQTVGAGSGMIFNDTFDSSCSQAYKNCVIAAENFLRSEFSNNVTLNLYFTAQAQGQNGGLASNSWSTWATVSYAQLTGALTAHHSTALADLPANDPNPAGGRDWYLPEAYARMLGLTSYAPAIDDTITLNTSYNWNYGQDVINTIVHEISEGAMGRVGGLGDQNGVWSTMDLFRFNSSGQHDYTDGRDGRTTYFSANNGSTLAVPFNNEYSGRMLVNYGDTADFASLDVFGYGSPGETNAFSQTDLQVMTALGWNTGTPTSTPPPHVTPTINVANFTVAERQAVSESTFFKGMTNPSGDAITEYAFGDAGFGNGHLTVGGIAQPDGRWILVSAQQLASVGYIGGPRPGSETLYVDAYDATTGSWTAYATLTATISLTGQSATAGHGPAAGVHELIQAMAGWNTNSGAHSTGSTSTPPESPFHTHLAAPH